MAEAPPSPEDDAHQQARAIQNALRSPIPRIYANGFIIAQTAADLTVILVASGIPAGALSLSYISAKSLVVELSRALSDFETATKQTVPTINEVGEAITKLKGRGVVIR